MQNFISVSVIIKNLVNVLTVPLKCGALLDNTLPMCAKTRMKSHGREVQHL